MKILKSELELEINGRAARAYIVAPEEGGPGVLVLHAWWGLKPFFKHFCDRLAAAGFTVLAPDLYQGRTADTIEAAKVLMGQRDFDFMVEIVEAATNRLASLARGSLGILGFSMGASWALVVAANEPAVKAVVLFYGGDRVEFKEIHAQVLGHFAEQDEWESLEGVREMKKDMEAAGLTFTLHTYPEAHHWFMEDDRPEYDPSSAGLAWERTIDFLNDVLK